MYYVLHGKNNKEARKKLKSLVETLHAKRPGAEVFRVTTENWNADQFNELLIAQGLFDQKYIIVLDMLLEDKEIKEVVVERVKEMKESDSVFLLIETDIDKKTLTAISKYAEKVQDFEGGVVKKDERFNTFVLADLFGARDRKNLWVSYLRALDEGISPEEIGGVLFWQIKNIILVQKTSDAWESKLSPFVDSKSRRFAKNFTDTEIASYASSLIDATQGVRNGEGEMEVLLEKIILEV